MLRLCLEVQTLWHNEQPFDHRRPDAPGQALSWLEAFCISGVYVIYFYSKLYEQASQACRKSALLRTTADYLHLQQALDIS